MPVYLKQSTASQEIVLGPFLDSTDGNTAETGLTIANTDIKLWLAGAITLADKTAGGATHIANGIYYAVLDATDTATLGSMTIFCHPTGALATKLECCVLAANVYDALIGGGDLLEVDTTFWGGTAVASAVVPANAIQISGDATAADNLETMLDGTGGQSLTLGSIVVNNSAGTAVSFTSSGGNGNGLLIAGNGTGAGFRVNAGTTGIGLDINGGATSGVGMTVDSTSGDAVQFTAGGGNSDGLQLAGFGTGQGLSATGGTLGGGASFTGGATLGRGIVALSYAQEAVLFQTNATNEDALMLTPNGTGLGINGTLSAVNTVNGLAADVVTAASLATDAVTEIQTGLSTLDAAGVRTAVGLASANLDTQLGAVPAAVWSATFTLPGQVAPSNTPTAEGALGFMYKLSRNKIEQTATTTSVYDDAGTTVDHKSTISDDATTFTRGEFAAGP